MDELKNLEELILTAKNVCEKLQSDIDELQNEKKVLAEENLNLREENEKLRVVIENMVKKFQAVPDKLNSVIRKEFQKIFTGSTSVVKSDVEISKTEKNLPINMEDVQREKKMIYAEFYAEEAGFKEE